MLGEAADDGVDGLFEHRLGLEVVEDAVALQGAGRRVAVAGRAGAAVTVLAVAIVTAAAVVDGTVAAVSVVGSGGGGCRCRGGGGGGGRSCRWPSVGLSQRRRR